MRFQIVLPYHHTETDLADAVEKRMGARHPFRILKRSVDARQHRNIRVEYSVTTDLDDPADRIFRRIATQRGRLPKAAAYGPSPLVVGSGPGGLFCAYWLQLHGIQPVLLEQGPSMQQRVRDMARFMKQGDLHPWSNICFGAGGAGTYSDGKLITRIRSPYIPFIMQTFVDFGAPGNIRYLYNPHLGSNRIRQCITRMLETLHERGMDIRYETRWTGFDSDADGSVLSVRTHRDDSIPVHALFLATGHSAREVYTMLRIRGIPMDLKEFAIGVRVEHPAHAINAMLYGSEYRERYPGIETAQYRLAKTWKEDGRAVYSFCMCPGGYVLNASSDTSGVVTNGMSNYLKRGRFSNAAVVVNITRSDLATHGYTGIDAGLELQRELEERFRGSVNLPGRCNVVPGQRLPDFLHGHNSLTLGDASCLNPVAPAPMHSMFPAFIHEGLRRGFSVFDRKMEGFASHDQAQVFGIESRTSAPLRIERVPGTLVSPRHPNLYPVGEGAGYAGGITSAAVDGIRAAQAYIAAILGEDLFAGDSATGTEDVADE
ncbi:MAG: hypothetical protein JXA28_05105 [Bacteroidetes bacterium]|nr:hypothetical protein [Bacteroidota bacterium]